jgi:hypothetical protein
MIAKGSVFGSCTGFFWRSQLRWATLLLFFSICGTDLKAGSILREVYQNISGTAVSDLTNNPAYPDQPTSTNLVTNFFEAPVDFAENYGQRMRGYITPPLTGDYTFWIATDDNGSLYLSGDENPSNVRLLCWVPQWTASRVWNTYSEQQSLPVHLDAGRNYYIEAFQKEGGGGDNLAVRWLRPDNVDEAPIPATYLLPWGTSFTAPVILQEPVDTTVIEGDYATFKVVAKNLDVIYQWKKDGVAISAAQSATLTYGPVQLSEDGAAFTATLTNKLGSTNTTAAFLHVTPDFTPPKLISVFNLSSTSLQLTYSEPVDAATAAQASNYSFSTGAAVQAAAFGGDSRTIVLTTSPLAFGSSYTLNVINVKDRAQAANTIQPGSSTTFLSLELVSQDVGAEGGSIVRTGAGAFNVTGSGADIGGTSDHFQYDWQLRTGDFDFQVRIADALITDPYLHAGLMARGSLATNAAFAAAFGSSSEVGSFFESRQTAGAATATMAPVGGFPVNYPQTWLRLRRQNGTFTGFGSVDGITWVQLGATNLALPSQIYLGLALSSGDSLRSSTAQFHEYGPTQSTATGTYQPDREPLGPSSRRTGIIFSEIMYHPKLDPGSTNNLEFIELYNADSVFEDLSGWRISGGIDYQFPQGTILQSGAFLVVAADPAAIQSAYGISGVLGPFNGALNNSGDTVRLREVSGAVKLELTFGDSTPWPVAADGAGHSLVLTHPSYGEADPRAWSPSTLPGGSPGHDDLIAPIQQKGIFVNEFLVQPGSGQTGFIELYNHTAAAMPLSGCYLTDDPQTNKFRIPDGTTVGAMGYIAFDRNQLGFDLSAEGGVIYLISSDAARVLDAIDFKDQERGVSSGRVPDGSATVRRLSSPTPAVSNGAPRLEDVVINELMYAPISGDNDDEYVELYNRGTTAVDLSGWQLDGAIGFKFSEGVSLGANAYLVIGRNRERLLTNYPQLNESNTLGNYSGSLPDSGGRIALLKTGIIVVTNSFGELTTNKLHIATSEAAYYPGGRWGKYSNGGGSSMELIDPKADLLRASSWADSDETQKGQWTTNTFTGSLDNGMSGYNPDRFQILMQGAGECLVDDVEVIKSGTTVNLLANGGFETTTPAWTLQGNHSLSTIDSTGGSSGPNVLHVRSSGDGDPGINSIRTPITGLASGNTVTIRARVRWLAGWPEVLFRTRGNWIEMPVRMALPQNLGTPGLPNSRLIPNAGPAIYDVAHFPVLPQANQAVVVSGRVSDPDGIGAVTLKYRTDPATTQTSISMRDDGAGGDAIAGDGIYSATIPAKSAGTVIGFTIKASDRASVPAAAVFPAGGMVQIALPLPECYVRWGDPVPAGNIAHYHLWDSQASEGQRNNALNNTYRDTTVVYGNFRVIYNSGFRDKGSPFHSGAGSFSVINPDDEPLLGVTERIFRTTGNGGPDDTGIRNRLCAWIGKSMGIPYLHSHFMQLYRNGSQHENVSQDEEFPSGYAAKSWFPDGGSGDLYKIAVWFEFQDNNSTFNNVNASLDSIKSGGNYKLARYRWNWQTRGFGGTENNYTNIFNLVAVANDTSTNFVPNVLNLVDAEEWMRVFAYDRVLGNWDAWTYDVGQNMYAIKQPGFPWELMPWDIDFTLAAPSAHGPTVGLFGGTTDGVNSGDGQDGVMNRWFKTAAFRRMQWRAYIDLVNTIFVPENYRPVGDALSSALKKNGIANITAPTQIYSFMQQRRAYVQARLTQNDAPQFIISNNGGNDYPSSTGTTILTGKAPFVVAKILVNGAPYPVVWTDDRSFAINVPLTTVTNHFVLTALDRFGQPIAGLNDSITVTYKGAIPLPQDFVVINEINYNPLEAKASFLELYNSSTNTPFDVSGYRLEGLSYDFPAGAVIQPNAYLLLVKDRVGFANAFGAAIPVFDQFTGSLDGGGENLKLVNPLGLGGTNDLIISDVRYGDTLPWPPDADGFGSSLQLIDASKGSYRVGNWGAVETNSANRVTPGRANANKSLLPAFPLIWLNEVLPNNLTGPTDNNGQHDPMIELYNSSASSISLDGFYLTDNYTNLNQWAFPPGTAIAAKQFLIVWADGQTEQSVTSALHTSFRLNPTNGSVALVRNQSSPVVMDFLDYKQLPRDRSFGSFPDGEPRGRRSFFYVTPGAANNPDFPGVDLKINEYMADNLATIIDPATGQFDDWFELYNAGTNAVDLTSYRLTHQLTNSSEFSIPPGYVVAPGAFLLVWADKATGANQSTNSELHANFKLTKAGGEIGLFDPNGSLVDSVVFGGQATDISEGRFPDGGEGPAVAFNVATPGTGNVLQGANQPPALTVPADQTVAEGMLLSQTIVATDPDSGQSLTFSLGSDTPPGAAIDPISGQFTWTPTEEQGPGAYSISVRVTDNGIPPRSATRRFNVSVTEANRPPVLAAIEDSGIDEGALFSFTAKAVDPDVPGNSLTFSLLPGAPEGASIDRVTGAFSWIPSEAQGAGIYPITIQVSDGEFPAMTDSKSFQVTVREVNNPPVLAVVEPQSVDEGQPLRFSVSAVDPDSPPQSITYSLEGGALPSGLNIDPVTGLVTWTPTEGQGPATYFLVVRATENDSQHLSAMQSIGITVREVNRPPVLKGLSDLRVEEGTVISFAATGTDADLPAQTLTYSLLPGAPAGAVIDQNTGVFLWATPEDDGPATNSISIRVTDDGPGNFTDTKSFSVVTTPKFRAVINEIMYHPAAAGGAYVELFNPSRITTQTLGGLRLASDHLRFEFPTGTQLAPGKFLVVAQNQTAFHTAYGASIPIAGQWTGTLDRSDTALGIYSDDGQGHTNVWNQVAFAPILPWPTNADSGGASLQLVDALQDNTRPGNWTAVDGTGANATPQWQHVVLSGSASSSTIYMYLETVGDVYLDDVQLVAGSTPETGANLLPNGGFESSFPGPWTVSPNLATSAISTSVKHSGNASLHMVTTAGGTTRASSIYQDLVPALTQNASYTLSYWYLPNTKGGTLTLRLSGSGIKSTINIAPAPGSLARSTPGAGNNVVQTLPKYPSIWINELLPNNQSNIVDARGEHEPWLELINTGATSAELTGWWLTDTYTNLNRWPFPNGASVPANGFLLIFADGQPIDSTAAELHTSFRIPVANGSLALVRPQSNGAGVVDYLNYGLVAQDDSVDSVPDGQAFLRKLSSLPTPGALNLFETIANAPVLSASIEAGDAITLSWFGESGVRYRVEFATELSNPSWTALTELVGANSPISTSDHTVSANRERYYRIIVY